MLRAISVFALLLLVPVHLFAQCCVFVTKTVDCDISMVGDEVNYTISVTNCSDVTLYDVTVFDDVMGDISAYFQSELPPGAGSVAFLPYEIQPGDDNGLPYPSATLVNHVEVTATDASGSTCSDMDSAAVMLVHPDLDVELTCLTEPVPPGEEAQFELWMTNVGDVPLIVEPNAPGVPSPVLIEIGDTSTSIVVVPCDGDMACLEVVAEGFIPEEYCGLDANVIDADQSCCQCSASPADGMTWGVIKALYR